MSSDLYKVQTSINSKGNNSEITLKFICQKMCKKILKGQSESVSRRRTQWPKEKVTIYKTIHKTKDLATRTPLKTECGNGLLHVYVFV